MSLFLRSPIDLVEEESAPLVKVSRSNDTLVSRQISRYFSQLPWTVDQSSLIPTRQNSRRMTGFPPEFFTAAICYPTEPPKISGTGPGCSSWRHSLNIMPKLRSWYTLPCLASDSYTNDLGG